MVALVCLLSMIVPAIAFRSILTQLKAALSVAAAYGVLTFAFDPIVSFVPLLMFAILFGLSMDYEVFLLTEIREHHRKDRRAVPAVSKGSPTRRSCGGDRDRRDDRALSARPRGDDAARRCRVVAA